MAKYGSPELTIEVDNNLGAAQDISEYVTEINGLDVEAILEESHGFGADWVEQFFTGLKRANELTLGGPYDDAANGPNAIFVGQEGDTREVAITWGGSNASTFDAIIRQYRRIPSRGELTKWEVALMPTGEVVEAP